MRESAPAAQTQSLDARFSSGVPEERMGASLGAAEQEHE